MGLALEDFRDLTPSQFAITYHRYLECKKLAQQTRWEQARFTSALLLSRYSKKPIAPQDIYTFSWEIENNKAGSNVNIEATKKRFNELKEKWGNGQ